MSRFYRKWVFQAFNKAWDEYVKGKAEASEIFDRAFEDAVSQQAAQPAKQPPAQKDTEMEERMKNLEQFVQSITGRKDEG